MAEVARRGRFISPMFGRGLRIWSLTFVATPLAAALAQGKPPSPWTDERANALVRIEAPGPNALPAVATGFIVNGHGGKQYVATVTHGLLPGKNDYQNPDNCEALPAKTRLFQGNTGGPELRPDCAYHIGKDVSLVELYPGVRPLPALSFLACDLAAGDEVHLGGFALGLDRITMVGQVRGNGRDGKIIADSLTSGGLSGGPYLTTDGDVVGIHQGILENSPGFATILPVLALRTRLETRLPAMTEEDDCPKPHAHRGEVDFKGVQPKWNVGDDPLPLDVPADAGMCFLTKIWGKFNDREDTVGIELRDGKYVLSGSTKNPNGDFGAAARCFWYD